MYFSLRQRAEYYSHSLTLIFGLNFYARSHRFPLNVPDEDKPSRKYNTSEARTLTILPLVVSGVAVAHLAGRFFWHYCWEYAYAWRVWRRYKAAIQGVDTQEENKFRECHVFVEATYCALKTYVWPLVRFLFVDRWKRKAKFLKVRQDRRDEETDQIGN
jgi:hypothetical protein